MSPAEAGAIDLGDEPDWRARFEEFCTMWESWSPELREDNAFEATLKEWRRFHATPFGDKKKPAPAIDGIVALAELRVMAPRSLFRDIPRDGVTGYQHDDHCWLSVRGEQWRIAGVEDRMLCLERMDGQTKQIDLSTAKWSQYTEHAVRVLNAMK